MSRHYPNQITLDGHPYEVERILKDDFYSVNVLYQSPETPVKYVLKLSDFRFWLGTPLRPFSSLMSWREYQIYKQVADLEGVPPLGPRFGNRGYFHVFVEGKTLFEIKRDNGIVPEALFTELRELIEKIHKRSIYYVDLNKLGNIIAGDDGKTYLIDYQICLPFPKSGLLALLTKPLFNLLIQDDLYHIYKHKSRFQPELMTDEEKSLAKKSGLKQLMDNLFFRHFRFVKRLMYPHGSNEIIWYEWEKMQKSGKAPPMEMP